MTTTDGSYYLKWLKTGRIPSYQGGAPLPVGEWTDTVTDPVTCKRGWHACRWEDAVRHISDELWICRLDGTIVEGTDKVAAERLMLIEQVPIGARELRLFAADCAEDVLPLFEQEFPDDGRPREAIRMARLLAEGETTAEAARAAVRAAAWAADRADRAAARATGAAWAADRAAWAAEAAGKARAAAEAAARDTQTERLLVHYAGLDPDDFARREVIS